MNAPEIMRVGKVFQSHFKVSFRDFYDPQLSVIFDQVKVNLPKFDSHLHRLHGNYEAKGLSMADIIEEHYGEEATNFIITLL